MRQLRATKTMIRGPVRDTTPDDPMHLSTILDPGEVFHGAHGIRIENNSNTFELYVQLVDEINFKSYRTWDEGKGFRIITLLEENPNE